MGADRRRHGSESGARVPRGALGDAALRDVGIPATRAARRAPARRAGASRSGGRPVRGLSSSSACRCARREDRGRPGAGRGCAGVARAGTPRRGVARRLGRARRRARAGGSLEASRRRVRRSGLRVARSPGAGPQTQPGDGACSRGRGARRGVSLDAGARSVRRDDVALGARRLHQRPGYRRGGGGGGRTRGLASAISRAHRAAAVALRLRAALDHGGEGHFGLPVRVMDLRPVGRDGGARHRCDGGGEGGGERHPDYGARGRHHLHRAGARPDSRSFERRRLGRGAVLARSFVRGERVVLAPGGF